MRPKSRNDFAIAIICALPLEADAVEALFDETYDRLGKHYGKQPGDVNVYINGRIGRHHVVLCYLPGMGKGSAASVASSLQVSYTGIQLALVVGICGGAPPPPKYDEIFFSDIIISDTVMEYDFGRQYPGGFQRKTGVKDTLGRPDREIRTLLKSLQAYNSRIEFQNQVLQYLHTLQQAGTRWQHPDVDDVLFKASYLHKHHGETSSVKCCCLESNVLDSICHDALEKNCKDLRCDNDQVIRRREPIKAANISVHIGTIGSADKVMKSGQHRDAISRKEEIIGFEMEGAGVWDNAPCVVIKGVCDYADSHKSKAWQAYAAATGASAAKAFLEYWRPVNHEDASKNRHLMIPFGRNPRFVGRHDENHKLEDLISMPDGAKKIAITGLGGVGKTQAVEQAFRGIAQVIGIQDVKPAEIKECIKAYFSQIDRKWLLIFDNADDLDMWMKGSSTASALKDFLPYNTQGHIIFTTRNRKLAVKLASSDVVHVRELDEKAGMEYLERSLIEESLLHNHHAMITLLEQLTFLPLAVTQAAAYMNGNGIGVSDYLLLLQEQEADVVELLSEDFGDDGRYKDAQNPVAITWLISFYQIQKLDKLASDYLSHMACVDPRNIPESFLPQPTSKKKMIDALGLLSAYSFITIQPGNGSITLHRLVHLATRNWMKKADQFTLYIRKTADRLSETFPHNDHTNRQLWREYLPHALFLLGANEFQENQEQYVDYIENVGTCLDSDGRYKEAEKLLVQVMEIRKQVLGPEHPSILTSMANLASTYRNQGRWKEAEELQLQVMETWKQVLGPEHPSTLTSMANLASTYRDQGRWKEAEELFLQGMETLKQVLGPEHPSTLTRMANLTSTYWNQGQGRWKEAEELLMQVMETWKQVLGPEHPDTLNGMHNLASTYWNQGRWKEAEELFLQVIKTRKQVLGPEHPDTLTSMHNLVTGSE
ncbi:uncharacterized protein ACHE_50029A [Aspergillus chevalieri]|uniref:Nucleoside phosphorylase domain-containing protein n=1 Tax=Aspergillus chevalieri TaxID=182096 RepID=A0A7R7VQD6_ASPCH|nr:uncharacterized protein ACHE_50029A [Aspergillus chevalieri]BCR88831.1 hypothetical protein ACHE_50029A [Aspergillus chevalieri]